MVVVIVVTAVVIVPRRVRGAIVTFPRTHGGVVTFPRIRGGDVVVVVAAFGIFIARVARLERFVARLVGAERSFFIAERFGVVVAHRLERLERIAATIAVPIPIVGVEGVAPRDAAVEIPPEVTLPSLGIPPQYRLGIVGVVRVYRRIVAERSVRVSAVGFGGAVGEEVGHHPEDHIFFSCLGRSVRALFARSISEGDYSDCSTMDVMPSVTATSRISETKQVTLDGGLSDRCEGSLLQRRCIIVFSSSICRMQKSIPF